MTKFVSASRLGLKDHLTFSWPGARTEQLQSHFRKLPEEKMEGLQYVVIHVGTNDLCDTPPDEVAEKISSLVDSVRARVPLSCKVFVGQIIPRNDDLHLDYLRSMVNKRMKTLVRRRTDNVFILNFESVFQKSARRRKETPYIDTRGKEELLAFDGLHLSFASGINKFCGCLRMALKRHMLIPKDSCCPPTTDFTTVPRSETPNQKCLSCNAKGHRNGVCGIKEAAKKPAAKKPAAKKPAAKKPAKK